MKNWQILLMLAIAYSITIAGLLMAFLWVITTYSGNTSVIFTAGGCLLVLCQAIGQFITSLKPPQDGSNVTL